MPAYVVTLVRPGSIPGGPAGFTRTMIVSYTVGAWGPFEVEIPQDKFTPEEVARVVGIEAAKIAALQSGGS